MLILPSTVTTTGQIEVRWISAISSCCTSRFVAGDDITRARPGAKYLWLMFFRQRTKWTSCKVSDVDGSSAAFVIALKIIITSSMISNFSFCNKQSTLSTSQYRTFLYLMKDFIPFPGPRLWRWVWNYGRMLCPYLYQWLRNFNDFPLTMFPSHYVIRYL